MVTSSLPRDGFSALAWGMDVSQSPWGWASPCLHPDFWFRRDLPASCRAVHPSTHTGWAPYPQRVGPPNPTGSRGALHLTAPCPASTTPVSSLPCPHLLRTWALSPVRDSPASQGATSADTWGSAFSPRSSIPLSSTPLCSCHLPFLVLVPLFMPSVLFSLFSGFRSVRRWIPTLNLCRFSTLVSCFFS